MNSVTNTKNTGSLISVASILLVFASVLGFFTSGKNVLDWDLAFATWIQRWEGALGESLYRVGDVLGTTSLAAAVTVVALVVALLRKHLQISVFLVLVLLFRLVGTQLKPLFDSPRPTSEHLRLLETYEGTGYPSGHSMTVAMVATMLVFIAWRYANGEHARWVITALSFLATLLVGWSRVWSGAHWPSDVLGGWSFGIALVTVAWLLSEALTAQLSLRRDTSAQRATS